MSRLAKSRRTLLLVWLHAKRPIGNLAHRESMPIYLTGYIDGHTDRLKNYNDDLLPLG